MNLTDTQLDKIIAKADKIFDSIEVVKDNYELYHGVAASVAYMDFKVQGRDYDRLVIDGRCQELNQIELDRIM